MSPDDVFAAQFWPWPDPAIKRDAQGRVLFVNAAFLALYGGRIEDWRGNAVGGWSAPQPPVNGQLTPCRFETRLQDEAGGEHVFDWIEQTLADGNAFALARNVTVFTYAPDPGPGEAYPAPQDDLNAQTQETPAQPPQAEAPVQNEPTHHPEPVLQMQAPEAAPSAEPEVIKSAPAAADMSPPIPDIPIPEIEIPDDESYALTQSVEPEDPQEFDVPEADIEAEAPREFERRALPLDAESTVLGNNWRDAVIARAVGAEESTSKDKPAQAEEAPTPSGTDEPIRILLAEDNAINALLTRTLLEAEGHSVDTVEDGALAVEAMKTGTYDLIFMDMRMPNMDGLEATRKIRTLPNVSRHLPIIALTANAFDDDRNACFDSGMNDFMTKPVSAEELSEMVIEWTGPKAEQRLAS